jgi:phospho-N-acetylmuramoyl-pentapeptide-transferase
MLYHLFTYLKEQFNMPGAGVFYFISFRTAMAIILSLIISLVYGKRLIKYLHRKQIGETVRDLGLEGEKQKSPPETREGISYSNNVKLFFVCLRCLSFFLF